MIKRDIVVVGGSAGSLEALRDILRSLAGDIRAAIFIVVHRPYRNRLDRLPWLLSRYAHMKVTAAVDGEAFEYGHVYIAPPNAHMLVEPGIIRIEPFAAGQRLSGVDALFQSAAKAYGDRSADAALAIEKLLEKKDCPNRVILSDKLPTLRRAKGPSGMLIATAAEHMIKITRMTLRYRRLRRDGKIAPLAFFDSGNLTRGR